jgi:hypothetical protein
MRITKKPASRRTPVSIKLFKTNSNSSQKYYLDSYFELSESEHTIIKIRTN